MPDDAKESYDYTDLLTKLIKSMPNKVNLNILQKRTRKMLSQIAPDSCRNYLESALLENLATFYFETDDEGNVPKEAAVMAEPTRDVHKELLLAAANAVDDGDLDTASFLLHAADDLIDDDEEITELEEEVQNSPYHRLPLIEERATELGISSYSWVRVTVDRANRDPQWVKYCRLHRAPHVGPLTWDFPILPHEDVIDVLRTIREETGYSPRWYEQLDYRVDGTKDIPATPFMASGEREKI